MNLLCISNGHGEDIIALRILIPLRDLNPAINISALPISGSGSAYNSAKIPLIGTAKTLPSGGFLNQDPKQLAKDISGGLIALTRSQLTALKTWRQNHAATDSHILAVGDIVPLLFAYRSGLPYHFIGTAKSEYWLRDERGKLPSNKFWSRFEGWSGSVYLPWERWLMSRPQCRSVFVRDALTASYLKKFDIDTTYAGNPMMDNLAPIGKLNELLTQLNNQLSKETATPPEPSASVNPERAKAIALFLTPKPQPKPLTLALIPGSRPPEAYENWKKMLDTVPGLIEAFPERTLIFLAAIAPGLNRERLEADILDCWCISCGNAARAADLYPTYRVYRYGNAVLVLVTDAFNDCLDKAEIAIATAGTATEQFVGLGKPAITLPGNGPQFTQSFATTQAKMLGPSVQIVNNPNDVGSAIAQLITNPDHLQLIYNNGKQRMGNPNAGQRIAAKLLEKTVDQR